LSTKGKRLTTEINSEAGISMTTSENPNSDKLFFFGKRTEKVGAVANRLQAFSAKELYSTLSAFVLAFPGIASRKAD